MEKKVIIYNYSCTWHSWIFKHKLAEVQGSAKDADVMNSHPIHRAFNALTHS